MFRREAGCLEGLAAHVASRHRTALWEDQRESVGDSVLVTSADPEQTNAKRHVHVCNVDRTADEVLI